MADKVMNEFQWAEKYKQEGAVIFKETSQKSLRLIQESLRGDIYTYFYNLAGKFGNKVSTAEKKQVVELVDLTLETADEVDKLLTINSSTDREALVQSIYNKFDHIRGGLAYFSNPENFTGATQQRLKELERDTGTSASGLGDRFKVIQGRMNVLEKPKSKFEQFKEKHAVLGGVASAAGGIAGGIGEDITEGFGFLGQMGKSVFEAQKKKKERAAIQEQQKFIGNVMPQDTSIEKFQSTYSDLYGKGKGKVETDVGASSRHTLDQKAALDNGLTSFFTTGAYRAKWTKDLLAAVSVGAVAKEPKEEGDLLKNLGLGDLGATLGSFGKSLASFATNPITIGVAGLAMGAWDAFKGRKKSEDEGWLTGKAGQKQTLGQNIASSSGSFLGGTGPGIGEKGATVGGIAKNALWNTIKGAAIGFMVAGPIGALVGGGIGLTGGLIGGKRISQGLQATTRFMGGQDIQTGASRDFTKVNPKTGMPDLTPADLMGRGRSVKAGVKFGETELLPKFDQVPLSIPGAETLKVQKEGFESLNKTMDNLLNESKSKKDETSASNSSGYDAYNIRDPLLASLNTGILDIA